MARLEFKYIANNLKAIKAERTVGYEHRNGSIKDLAIEQRIETRNKVLDQVLADLKHAENFGGIDHLIDLATGKKQQKSLFEEA